MFFGTVKDPGGIQNSVRSLTFHLKIGHLLYGAIILQLFYVLPFQSEEHTEAT